MFSKENEQIEEISKSKRRENHFFFYRIFLFSISITLEKILPNSSNIQISLSVGYFKELQKEQIAGEIFKSAMVHFILADGPW